jgi:hypothetical protein
MVIRTGFAAVCSHFHKVGQGFIQIAQREEQVKMRAIPILAVAVLVLLFAAIRNHQTRAHAETSAYSAMAPLDQYLIADKNAEIALARSAAPTSISAGAEVMVLGRDGYTTAVKGTNGFLCIVERSWASPKDEPDFWNPKIRAPICFNPAAAKTFAPIFLMKTKLVLEGKSKPELAAAVASALDSKQLPALDPGSMCYMMSREQYLNDRGKSWQPHVMVFATGDVAKSWGANLPGSPVLAADDAEQRVTIFMIPVSEWSDASPATPIVY